MFFPCVVVASLLAAIPSVIAAPVIAAATDTIAGTISAPVNGSGLVPGEPFNFTYNTIADYGISSYNYTVWLVTTPPNGPPPDGAFVASPNFINGYYFGRFSAPNYPGNPNPNNLAPAQLVVPNFSLSPGGFGTGITASNAPVFLTVLEEYADGEGVLGYKMSLTYNKVIYNATGNELPP